MPLPQSSNPPPPQSGENPYAALIPQPGQQAQGSPAAPPAPPASQPVDNPYAAMVPGMQQQASGPAAPTPGLPVTILDQATRGLGQGFAPQLMGVIKAVEGGGKYIGSTMAPGSGGSWSGLGNAMSQGYTSGRDDLRAQYDAERAAHPTISRIADIGGSIGGVLISGGSNMLASGAEKALTRFAPTIAPKILSNMLTQVALRGTLPAIEAGAERAIGETRDNNYVGNVAQSILPSAAIGTLLGTGGQLAGRWAEGRAGAAAKGAQYAQSDAAQITDPDFAAKFRDYIDRPNFAKAYQRAVDQAADEGNPLPELPMRQSQAPFGNVEPTTEGTAPSPFPQGVSVRLIDAFKRAVDEAHNQSPKADGYITKAAYENFYKDIIHPADQVVPVFGAARGSAEKVIQARQLGHDLISPGKSLPVPIGGAGIGYMFGHPAVGGALGLAARLGTAMAHQPAAGGFTPDASAVLSRALAAAAAQRSGQ